MFFQQRKKLEGSLIMGNVHDMIIRRVQPLHYNDELYSDLPGPRDSNLQGHPLHYATSLSNKLGIVLPNPAPDVNQAPLPVEVMTPSLAPISMEHAIPEPRKKKYAKEAWPGKKPNPSLLV